ncbi:MAG: DNA polymerase III subunit delta [Gammaproteobacteria bacterium]
MKLNARQLPRQLESGLAPLYFISGDEPLLVQEACDLVRRHAREQGCSERIVIHAESGFDWNSLLQEASGMSLFAERRLLELRLPGGRPGEAGGRVLQAYGEQPPPDNVLLIISGKIDAAQQRSRWFKALEQAGVVVQVWPLTARELPAWIEQRMRGAGLRPQREAVLLLAERVEGNLLAAVQEIEKLRMLHGAGPLGVDEVLAAVADSARFDVFALVDSALAGDGRRAARILGGLRREGVEPVLVLWALGREIRSLAAMAALLAGGTGLEQVLARQRVWEKRKPLLRQALQRHDRRRWQHLLRRAAHLDRLIKGQAAGNIWDELLQLSLEVAGISILEVNP